LQKWRLARVEIILANWVSKKQALIPFHVNCQNNPLIFNDYLEKSPLRKTGFA